MDSSGQTHSKPGRPRFLPGNLPRLPREYYQGDAMVLWTLSTFNRAKGWLTDLLHCKFRELMLHAAAREGLFCPVYCLMPDHMHFVWMGLRTDSDQLNGMAFLRTYLGPALAPAKFQPQPHDCVLREPERKHDAFMSACSYLFNNPFRARLVDNPRDWPFTGAIIPGYPTLHPLQEDFWSKFWKLYAQVRDPAVASIKRPMF